MRARAPLLLGFAVASVANGLAAWIADHAAAIESGILDTDRQNARVYDDGRDAAAIIERDPDDPDAFVAPTVAEACAPDAVAAPGVLRAPRGYVRRRAARRTLSPLRGRSTRSA
jgi:hypothetical protein